MSVILIYCSSLNCQICPVGKASANGASVCIVPTRLCADGYYVTASTSTACNVCGAGSACYGGKCIANCGSCFSGMSTSENGAASCTGTSTLNCPSGYGKKLYGANGCYPCPAGTYNNGTMLFCLNSANRVNFPSGVVCSAGDQSCNLFAVFFRLMCT
jgi:hypothetical protein